MCPFHVEQLQISSLYVFYFFKEAYKILGFHVAFSNILSVNFGKGSKLYENRAY